MILIGFDVECTGDDFAKHAMVEIGAFAVEYLGPREPARQLATFETMIAVPSDRCWEERCVREFWENPARPEYERLKAKKAAIEGCKIDPETAARDFVSWVETLVEVNAAGDSSGVRFVTDNAAYDAAWMGFYLCTYAEHAPLTTFFDGKFQAVIDTSSYHQGLSRVDHARELAIKIKNGRYSEDRECRAALGVPDSEVPTAVHDHRAVHDAQEILEQHLILLRHA